MSNNIHRAFNRAETSVRTLGDMILDDPDDDILDARYELALRAYSTLARKVQAMSDAESFSVDLAMAV